MTRARERTGEMYIISQLQCSGIARVWLCPFCFSCFKCKNLCLFDSAHMHFEGKYHSLDFLSINAWNAPEVSSALCVTCFHQWVENLKTRIIITNKTVALAKEFVIAPYLGVGRGKKEKKK